MKNSKLRLVLLLLFIGHAAGGRYTTSSSTYFKKSVMISKPKIARELNGLIWPHEGVYTIYVSERQFEMDDRQRLVEDENGIPNPVKTRTGENGQFNATLMLPAKGADPKFVHLHIFGTVEGKRMHVEVDLPQEGQLDWSKKYAIDMKNNRIVQYIRARKLIQELESTNAPAPEADAKEWTFRGEVLPHYATKQGAKIDLAYSLFVSLEDFDLEGDEAHRKNRRHPHPVKAQFDARGLFAAKLEPNGEQAPLQLVAWVKQENSGQVRKFTIADPDFARSYRLDFRYGESISVPTQKAILESLKADGLLDIEQIPRSQVAAPLPASPAPATPTASENPGLINQVSELINGLREQLIAKIGAYHERLKEKLAARVEERIEAKLEAINARMGEIAAQMGSMHETLVDEIMDEIEPQMDDFFKQIKEKLL